MPARRFDGKVSTALLSSFVAELKNRLAAASLFSISLSI